MLGVRAVRLIAAALAAVAVISGFFNLVHPEDRERSHDKIFNRVKHHQYDAPIPPLRFVVTVINLNPNERRIQASLTLVPTASEEMPLFVDTSGKPVEQANGIRPEFAATKVEITLSASYSGKTTISFPLANIVDPYGSPDSRQLSASIPTEADPTQFPNDTYSTSLSVHASVPPGVVATAPLSKDHAPVRVEAGDRLPVAVGLALDDRLGQWSIETDRIVAGGMTNSEPRNPRYAADITAEFGRRWSYWAFIYAISLMPAVIGLSFYVRTRRRGVSTTDTSAAMELAAAVLALIALRQVFVPTDIVGLTRLDALLGVQLLAVCLLMAVTYVAEPPPASNTSR